MCLITDKPKRVYEKTQAWKVVEWQDKWVTPYRFAPAGGVQQAELGVTTGLTSIRVDEGLHAFLDKGSAEERAEVGVVDRKVIPVTIWGEGYDNGVEIVTRFMDYGGFDPSVK